MKIVNKETDEIIIDMPLCRNNLTLDEALEVAFASITDDGVVFDDGSVFDYDCLEAKA